MQLLLLSASRKQAGGREHTYARKHRHTHIGIGIGEDGQAAGGVLIPLPEPSQCVSVCMGEKMATKGGKDQTTTVTSGIP